MCFAGLWDCVQYEGSEEKLYTYTIITTNSNKQLNFLHDRMPVILENGSEDLRTWLDPRRYSWSNELQSLLKPYEGELDIYPVDKAVGKVGNDSPNFIVPVASTENKSNIANFFAKGANKSSSKPEKSEKESEVKEENKSTSTKHKPGVNLQPSITKKEDVNEVKVEEKSTPIKHEKSEVRETIDHSGTEDNAPLPIPKSEKKKGVKRELDDVDTEQTSKKVAKTSVSPSKEKSPKQTRTTRSATSNKAGSPKKSAAIQEKGTQRITNFFKK